MRFKYASIMCLFALAVCCTYPAFSQLTGTGKVRVLFDTDANNELDDQHALAYLFFNGGVFDVAGVTVNATYNGGNINGHYEEAKRVMQLCNVFEKIPLLKGADGNFATIRPHVGSRSYDGSEGVNFIIAQAHQAKKEKLLLLPVGKLTNIALALAKDPSIAKKVRIVWLGSNYPEPGEYNQDNDTAALNYILNTDVPFEMVTVRYGKPSGTAAVTATRSEVRNTMAGLGPLAAVPVTGRHGGTFRHFGDYAINLFEHIETHDAAGSRALFDMAAVAIVKNPSWAQARIVPAPLLVNNQWVERPANSRTITVWENFNQSAIMDDFYQSMRTPVLVAPVVQRRK